MSCILKYNLDNPHRLPVGYTTLAYIESSDGKAYIDTGITIPSSGTLQISTTITASTRSGANHPFYGTNSYSTGLMGLYHYLDNKYYTLFVTGANKGEQSIDIPAGNLITSNVFLDITNLTGWSNIYKSNTKSTFSITKPTDFTSTIKIFTGSTNNFSPGYHKCYKFAMLVNGIAVCDYVPAKNSSGTVGMFDLVTQTFKTSANTSGAFVAGPEVVCLPAEYLLVEYILFNPGKYYSTGISIATSHTLISEVGIRYASGQSTRDLWGYSGSGGGYQGVTAAGVWELHGGTSTETDITKYNIFTRTDTLSETGTYLIGALGALYTTRTKYISYLKLNLDSTDVVDYVACYRKSDNLPGFYDFVSSSFKSLGSGFILGPNIYESNTQLEYNQMGINLWNKDNTWTITTGTNRKQSLNFNGFAGPWTVAFDAVSTTAMTCVVDICDLGYKTINITTTKQRFYTTATATNYYGYGSKNPTSYNGFVDIEVASGTGTITVSNITLTKGNYPLPYVANATGLPVNLHSYKDSTGYSTSFNDGESIITTTFEWRPTTTFTINGWVYYATTPATGAIVRNSTKYSPIIDFSTGSLRGFFWTSASAYVMLTTALPSAGTWHMYSLTYNGATLSLYIDGTLKTSTASTASPYSTGYFQIGGEANSGYLQNTQLKDLRIYDECLSATAIADLYNTTK